MVHVHLRAFGGFLQLIQGDAGLHHHIRRCKRRKIHILHIEPLHAVGRVVARLDHAPQVVEILTGSHRLILNVLRPQIRLHDGIQHHRIRALRRIHPLLRQQIRQLIRPRRLLRQLHLNLIVIPPVCVVEIRGRHVKYGRLAVGAHGVHASVLLQRQGQLPCLQKITIALTRIGRTPNDNRFLQNIGLQIVAHIHAPIDIRIGRPGIELIRNGCLEGLIVLRKREFGRRDLQRRGLHVFYRRAHLCLHVIRIKRSVRTV